MKASHFASIAALATLTIGMVDAGGSKAAIFTVGGQDYDVTTSELSPLFDSIYFNTPANGGRMPWWGNYSLADAFAQEVRDYLGLPNDPNMGPFFAIEADDDNAIVLRFDADYGEVSEYGTLSAFDSTYALATLVTPSPVPGPLPLLGVATAFRMSRRLRRRIKSQSYKL